ncbi:MAG TPA: ABC transporter substrate-binding protein [Casimicrobiaceae bacterium]|nr:ABC transporter substrate-binding protein [Casimicrobiaceae bacterium]
MGIGSVTRRLPPVVLAAAMGLTASALAPQLAAGADPGKVLHLEFEVAETGFDPCKVQDYYSFVVNEGIFDSLLTYDYLARPAKLVPRAAEALPEVRDQARTYVFKIKKGIYFASDPAFKGRKRELTAEDFVYSIKRFVDPSNHSPYESFIEGIAGLEKLKKEAEKTGKFDYDRKVDGLQALDRYTLQIKLKETDYTFPYVMALANFGAVAREVIEAYADDTNAHPVGTGPYQLKEWVRSSKIILEANPDFRGFVWKFEPGADPGDKQIIAAMAGKKMPQIGRVEISVIEEQQAAWLAFQNGELDVLHLREQFAPIAIPDNKVNAELAAAGARLDRITDPDLDYTYFNMTDPDFGGFAKEKIALRRAIFMSFDNAEYLRVIRKGQAMEAQYPIPPGVVGHDATYRTSIPYDPELANKLLDYFGYKRGPDGYRTWPDGRPVVLRYSSTPTSRDREIDELWQKSVERIGIRLQVDKNKFPEQLKMERACQLLSRTAAWFADYPDGDDFMQLLYGPNTHQNNNACFQLPEWDRIYEKTRTLAPDSAERNQLYRQLWRMAEVNGVWKLHDTRYRNMLVQPQVIGYKKHPILLAEYMYYDLDNSRRRK